MKKFTILFVSFIALLAFSPVMLRAADVVTVAGTAPAASPEMDALKARLNEIRTMKRSNLSRAEKKDLRMELRTMNSAAAAGNNNGIYLSIGAVVIIILLLILLL